MVPVEQRPPAIQPTPGTHNAHLAMRPCGAQALIRRDDGQTLLNVRVGYGHPPESCPKAGLDLKAGRAFPPSWNSLRTAYALMLPWCHARDYPRYAGMSVKAEGEKDVMVSTR